MSNFLESTAIHQQMALEEAILEEVWGDKVGWFDDVDVYFSEDGDELLAYIKNAPDDAEPLARFYITKRG